MECIVFLKEKLNKLPDSFHSFIEVGLKAFANHMVHKTKSIKKYISIINEINIYFFDRILKTHKKIFLNNDI